MVIPLEKPDGLIRVYSFYTATSIKFTRSCLSRPFGTKVDEILLEVGRARISAKFYNCGHLRVER